MRTWLDKVRGGMKPTEIIIQEFGSASPFPSTQVISKLRKEFPRIDFDIYYAIWNWEKPNKDRVEGLSSAETDEWILRLIDKWEKEQVS